jgi:hypothetical protein
VSEGAKELTLPGSISRSQRCSPPVEWGREGVGGLTFEEVDKFITLTLIFCAWVQMYI